MSSANNAKSILITGANRGIGLCILQRLAVAFPQNVYLLGTRDPAAGSPALEELRSKGVIPSNTKIAILRLEVDSPESITAAAQVIRKEYGGKLDVLINNAGVAKLPPEDQADLAGLHTSWATTFSVNVTAPFMLFQAFLPFLLESANPRVMNTSSGRGSLTRSMAGNLPPTAVVSYSVSKTALNGLTVEMDKILAQKSNGRGRVWSINPGHCKTEFNGFRGHRDPLDGAGAFEVLLRADEEGHTVKSGFWEEEGGKLTEIPW